MAIPDSLRSLEQLDISPLNGGTPTALAHMWLQVAQAILLAYPRQWAFIVA